MCSEMKVIKFILYIIWVLIGGGALFFLGAWIYTMCADLFKTLRDLDPPREKRFF